jgi:uncharacterized protein with von Willebrand factor type A (vWA) domain
VLTGFFLHLKSHRLPVSTREFLTLLEALEARVVSLSLDDFYLLARTTLVKNEEHFDRFDLAFGSYFKGVESLFDTSAQIPDEWLRRELMRTLSEEDRKRIEALAKAIEKKLLHQPITLLRAEAAAGNGLATEEALRRLFDLEAQREAPAPAGRKPAKRTAHRAFARDVLEA